jgi:hypothetical protein
MAKELSGMETMNRSARVERRIHPAARGQLGGAAG